ncbi:hypothetical protein L2E82_28598 [Cichorium intybus]|uniref:Uncharacterized protein n=1 Tax=Cichorium intybus TaxID=13427 RepID=A0ACB9CW70_CICIN|nr:hypothetical protein L2E82_28598 [Cichorium intybus]
MDELPPDLSPDRTPPPEGLISITTVSPTKITSPGTTLWWQNLSGRSDPIHPHTTPPISFSGGGESVRLKPSIQTVGVHTRRFTILLTYSID